MSLCRINVRPVNGYNVIVRYVSMYQAGASKVQLQKPSAENGHFQYSRNLSRDPKIKVLGIQPVLKGDLPMTFLLRRLGHAYEVYPLVFLTGVWACLFCVACYWSFQKIEVWLDRSKSISPWDWERARQDYWKKSTVLFDMDGRTRKRCELMEMLQDEMLDAAKKRGTR